MVPPAASENEEDEEEAENDGHRNADARDRRVGLTPASRHGRVRHRQKFYGCRRGRVNHIGNLRKEMSNSGYQELTLRKRLGNGTRLA